nr:family 1 glycosylhydrolase [Bacillus subtilis]
MPPTETEKAQNIWDYWFEKEPHRFFDHVEYPADTSQFYDNYKEDIRLMKELVPHNSFRMSISWSRLIPNGTGEINDKAANFYNNVIDELIANGIEPFVNLFHFDMPMALQKIGAGSTERRLTLMKTMQELASVCLAAE